MTPRELLLGKASRSTRATHGPDRDECRRMQAILLDLADRRTPSPDARAAIDHLETCRDCEGDLASTTLILTALRRLADEVDAATPPDGSWGAVVSRIEAPHARRLHVGNVAGALIGVALVVSVALPPILSVTYTRPSLSADTTTTIDAGSDLPIRTRVIPQSKGGLSYDPNDLLAAPQGSVPVRYPDNTRPAPGGGSGAQGQP